MPFTSLHFTSLCQLAQSRYQVTDNAKNMITAFDTFSLTASTVYSEDELKVVNDEIVETNSEWEVAEFVNDADDYVSEPLATAEIEIPSVKTCAMESIAGDKRCNTANIGHWQSSRMHRV